MSRQGAVRGKTKNELRCFCARTPLLAMYGVDDDNKLYVHVRIYKQQRIYGEVVVREGRVSLHCRECLRWHTVKIIQPDVAILVEDTEKFDDITMSHPPMLATD